MLRDIREQSVIRAVTFISPLVGQYMRGQRIVPVSE